MKNTSLLILLAASALTYKAEIIYENATTPEDLFNDSRLESGDQVTLAGTARLLTEFSFEYFGEFAQQGDERARLRLYLNNGPNGENLFATPGTLLYDSGDFTIQSGFRTVTVSDLSVFLPADSFTWTVQFSGVSNAESVGLLYYDPPTVGGSGSYFWQRENGQWLAVATPDAGNNFAAQAVAERALQIISLQRDGTAAHLRVTGATAGRTYSLQFKNSLNSTIWQNLPGQVTATGTEVTLTDTTASTVPMRFYRIVES